MLTEEDDGLDVKQVSDSDIFGEYLPWADPNNSGFKQKIEVGVFNNIFIKIISTTLGK